MSPELDNFTSDQLQALMQTLCEYLEVDRVEVALRRGLTELERRQLAFQLSIEFDLEDSGYRSS